eukprot:TRINITY_DN92056_c0_g1_i1.p1 TRINITY_DN92056_c0_g1~~TRINITY_DN92056_c0_g1_i1.p1  ORF type:complete len:565 (+),score=99.45 TRINITY_DN92056_c0_g1_i1:124-1818(+)
MVDPHGFERSPLIEDPKTRFFVLRSNSGENLVKSVECNAWATQRQNEQKLNDAFHAGGAVILVFSVNKSNNFQGYARMRGPTGKCSVSGDPFRGFGRLFDIEWLRLHDLDIGEVAHLRNPLDDARNIGLSRDGQELTRDVGAEVCRLIDLCVFNEDPKTFEPVVDDPAPLKAQQAAPPLPQSRPFPPPVSSPPQSSTPIYGHHVHSHSPPAHFAGAAPNQPQPYGGQPPPPYGAGYSHYPHAGAPPPAGHHAPPAHSMPPHGPPPAHWAGPPGAYSSRPRRRDRQDGRRRRRRRRSTSSSSSSLAVNGAATGEKKAKKAKKSKKEDAPDFLNMSYEDYTQWWQAKYGPSEIPNASAAQKTPAAGGGASVLVPASKFAAKGAGATSIFVPARPETPAQNSKKAASPVASANQGSDIATTTAQKLQGQRAQTPAPPSVGSAAVAEAAVAQPVQKLLPTEAAAGVALSDSEDTSSAESDLPGLEEAAAAGGLAWVDDSDSSDESDDAEVAPGAPAASSSPPTGAAAPATAAANKADNTAHQQESEDVDEDNAPVVDPYMMADACEDD